MGRYKCFFILMFVVFAALAFVTGAFANSAFVLDAFDQYVLWFLIVTLYFIFAYILVLRGRAWFPYAVITRIDKGDNFTIFCLDSRGKKERTFDINKHQLKIEFPQRTKYTIYYKINNDDKLEKTDVDFYSENVPYIELPVPKDDKKPNTEDVNSKEAGGSNKNTVLENGTT